MILHIQSFKRNTIKLVETSTYENQLVHMKIKIAVTANRGISKRSHEKIGDFEQSTWIFAYFLSNRSSAGNKIELLSRHCLVLMALSVISFIGALL